MINFLCFETRIVLLAVTVSDGYLEAAVGFFDKNLSEDAVIVSNNNRQFTVELPKEVRNLRGRAKKYRVKLRLL